MEHRGPYQRVRDNGIDCEVLHPLWGWIPITLDSFDPPTADLWQEVENSGVTILLYEGE